MFTREGGNRAGQKVNLIKTIALNVGDEYAETWTQSNDLYLSN